VISEPLMLGPVVVLLYGWELITLIKIIGSSILY